jgi:tRNA U38,U39,U40 pseudouridine synthase TruA
LTDLDLRGNTFGKEGLYAVGNAILRKRVVFLKKEKEKKKFDPETYVKREYTYAIYFHGVEIAAQSTFSKVCAVS